MIEVHKSIQKKNVYNCTSSLLMIFNSIFHKVKEIVIFC